ncbi:acyltransferase [Dyella sp. 2HG41-7]|uniref:acyltransferase family protein n=1 Tax=Dyella sp. 2HG41-7 TaxID=2883239 RepID=UPI001F379573|nr:acyltransferase [Dyella sp. 2HG41-7]
MNHRRVEIPVLNGIRGLAVLVVFLSHASNIYFGGIIAGWGGGQLGVMLFFVLSGFLMAHLYMGEIASPVTAYRFAVNRMARIYPMFLLVVIFCFAISRQGGSFYVYPIPTLHEMLLHLAFVRGNEVLWTIGPEVIFYGLFVIAWTLRRRSAPAMWGYVLALAAVSWLPFEGIESNSLLQLHDKLPFFLAGMILGMHSGDLIDASKRQAPWMAWAFWLSFALFVLALPRLLAQVGHLPAHLSGDPWPHPWGYPIYLFATVLLFSAAVVARPWFLTNRVAQFLGRISYSFYLLHFMVLKNIQLVLPTHPVRAIALAALVTVTLSWLTYVLIETPARRTLQRLGPSSPKNVMASAA